MNAQTQVALAEVPEHETALAVYSADNGLEPWLEKIRAEVADLVPDTSTNKGRDLIRSTAFKIARSKTALDNLGKQLVADLKEVPKKIDAERKRMRDTLDALQEDVRRPLTEWEDAEKARIAQHESGIAYLKNTATEDMSAALIGAMIQNLDSTVIGDDWQEFEAEAHRAKAASLEILRAALAKQEQVEAEQAELAELRRKQAEQEQKDREARIAQEAAEQARLNAEAEAQKEREAAANRERDLQLQAERAERERLEGERRAEQAARDAEERLEQAQRDADARAEQAAQAERQRQESEQKRIADEAAAREADQAHKAKINRAAMEAFMAGGMTEECAKKAVVLIAKREIPNVQINY